MNDTTAIIDLPDLAATQALGAAIAKHLRAGDVVALSGALGAGKTTCARAILWALGHVGEVPSPSFAIIEVYDAPTMRVAAVHADFYRLSDPAEANELGLDDYRADATLIAEWPENAGGFADETACLSIAFEPTSQGRRAFLRGGAAWIGRFPVAAG